MYSYSKGHSLVPTIRSRHGVFVLFIREKGQKDTANAHLAALEPLPAFRRVCPANVVKDGRLFDARSHDAGLYHNFVSPPTKSI